MAAKAAAKTRSQRRKPQRKKGVTQPGEMTIPALAAEIGVSTTTIEKYIKRGCPRTSANAVRQWRAENIKAVAEDADPSELMIELKRAEIAQRNEIARAARIKNDRMEGELVRREDVIRDFALVLSRFKNRMLSLGTEAAMICPDSLKVPIKKAIDTTVEVALKEVVDGLDEWA